MKRNLQNKIISGVCAGIANRYNVDPWLVRIAFVGSFLLWGIGPLIYLLLWILIPAE